MKVVCVVDDDVIVAVVFSRLLRCVGTGDVVLMLDGACQAHQQKRAVVSSFIFV